jgi:hypothetical protein
MGPTASTKSTAGLSAASDKSLTCLRREGDPLRCGRSTHNVQSPSHSLRFVLGSRRSEIGLCEIGSGELPECAADMRPARRGPIGTQVRTKAAARGSGSVGASGVLWGGAQVRMDSARSALLYRIDSFLMPARI